MKRPSLQFYPKDWMTDASLRRCSLGARGAAMDAICLMHDSDEYGVLRWPLKEIANAAGVPIAPLRELASKGVLKGGDNFTGEFIYTPKHAGKVGEPVVLVQGDGGPCWFYARLVRDEHVRQRRGESTRFDSANNPASRTPKTAPMPPIGERQGDGASSASSSPDASYEASRQAPDIRSATDAGRACRLMRDAGCIRINPSHVDLLAALAEGVTPEALGDTAREGVDAGKTNPFAWAIKTARERRAAGPTAVTGVHHERSDQRRDGLADGAAGRLARIVERTGPLS